MTDLAIRLGGRMINPAQILYITDLYIGTSFAKFSIVFDGGHNLTFDAKWKEPRPHGDQHAYYQRDVEVKKQMIKELTEQWEYARRKLEQYINEGLS